VIEMLELFERFASLSNVVHRILGETFMLDGVDCSFYEGLLPRLTWRTYNNLNAQHPQKTDQSRRITITGPRGNKPSIPIHANPLGHSVMDEQASKRLQAGFCVVAFVAFQIHDTRCPTIHDNKELKPAPI